MSDTHITDADASFPQVLDSTILLTQTCPTKFYYQFCLGLSPAQKSIHLHAGGAFAHGVENVRKAFYIKKLPLDEALFEGWRKFIEYWGDYEAPENSYKSFENVSAALFSYFDHYNPNDDYIQPFVKSNNEPAVEFTFSIPLPINHPDTGEPLIYAGRCDMIGVLQKVSKCIVDEKTSYTFSPDWAKQFNMRAQFLGYTWAAQSFGIDVRICVVRGVAIQQRSIKHLEAILTFPQWQIDRWYQQMLVKVQFLVDCWKKKDFPLNYGDICSSYGGCPMMDLCQSENPSTWYDTYEIRKWSPLAVENVKGE